MKTGDKVLVEATVLDVDGWKALVQFHGVEWMTATLPVGTMRPRPEEVKRRPVRMMLNKFQNLVVLCDDGTLHELVHVDADLFEWRRIDTTGLQGGA